MAPFEEDGTDISMRERLDEAYAKAMNWTQQFLEIAKAAEEGNYEEALAQAVASDLPEDVKTRIETSLATHDEDLIRQVLADYKGRLGNAFCESCWGEQG